MIIARFAPMRSVTRHHENRYPLRRHCAWSASLPARLGILCAFACAGCETLQKPATDQLEQGLIWMFPGVEGGPTSVEAAYRGLRDGGVISAIRVHDWNRPFGLVNNLISHDDNRRVTEQIADQIENYRAEHAAQPIDLLGYSGGGGLAIMVAEALDPDVRLRNVVLVQPAISPDYDLSLTMHRARGHIVHFYCPTDWLILGLGTAALGTMDRAYVAAAGRNGFDVARAVPEVADRSRLIQISWKPDMIRTGHIGDHTGILTYGWNRQYVAPYLCIPNAAPG